MLGFSFAIFGPLQENNDTFPPADEVESLRTLMFTLVYSAIIKSGIDPGSDSEASRPDSDRELELDNFPSGDDPF